MLKKLITLLLSATLLVACGSPATEPTTGDKTGDIGPQASKQLTNLETLLTVSKQESNLVFDISLSNKANEDVEVTFPSGQKYEIIVFNEQGEEVYYYSADKTFIAAIENKVIKAGEILTWQETWDPSANGINLPAGTYQAEVEMNILTDVEGLIISQDSLIAKAEFTITAQEADSLQQDKANDHEATNDSAEELVLENNAFRNIEVTGKDGKYIVTGEGRVFEATMNYAVSDGHVYFVEDFYTLPEGAPSWSPFTLEISIPKDELPVNGTVMLELFELSAKDGSPVNILFVPLETIGY